MNQEKLDAHWKNIERFEPWIRESADVMGLKDWDIVLMKRPAPKDTCGQADCIWGRKSVSLYLSREFHLQTAEIQRQVLAHELVHAHFAPLHNPLHYILKGKARRFYVSAMEYGVDGIAEAIAPLLPLPPK